MDAKGRVRRLALIGAATAALATAGAGIGAGQAGGAGLPKKATVHITKLNTFSKPAVTVAHGGGTCSTTNYTVKFVNSSNVAQQVEEVGGPALGSPIPPKGSQVICTGIGTLKVTLASNLAATLSITVR